MLPFLEMPRQHYVKMNKIKKVSRIWVKEDSLRKLRCLVFLHIT